ncbi:FecR family protein [Spirosoma sp. KNUC1025]|uniref:FecR family protein n=1 Tax=Spirosoma sp. KNUC1025 TaxID=2894082 RepID=UPI001E4928C0|nr:FecR domain-containing protein [Spirosoma sp. KNUC1025]UFH57955.1 FecR domain-containing protein [Spirosoma sp. KNUC1025]
MPNSDFTVEDFCKDPTFIRWVLSPTDESNRFWQSFMADYPHKVADIRLAIDYVKTIQFREIEPTQQDLARLKQRIWKDIEQPDRQTAPVQTVHWYQRPYWAAAAVVLLVASIGFAWWTYQANSALTYQTAYGKIQEIKLADGSVVTLNANSKLKVADNLADRPVREVWLEGEAYFDIAKRKGAKFIVHTPEAQIEVLGTEFNVNTRRDQTYVVLEEGKVQLSTDNQSMVVMKPGDMATVSPKSRQIQLKRVQPDVYDAWKASYIILDGKSLLEIINSLEDTFGVTISLSDSLLMDRKLTGKLRTDVADDCIENLGIILDANVKKTGDTYRFD